MTNNAGTIHLEQGANLAISAATFTNTGQLLIDDAGGSSNVAFQTLVNNSTATIGVTARVIATSLVTATALVNTDVLRIYGYVSNAVTVGPTMTVNGPTTNTDVIAVAGPSTVDLLGAVSGAGTIVFNSLSGIVEFGAAVASTQQVEFALANGQRTPNPATIKLDDPQDFAATIGNLAVSDTTHR